MTHSFKGRVAEAFIHTQTCKAAQILFIDFIKNAHRVINGDHAHQSPIIIDNGRRDQVILVKGVGDIILILLGRDGAKAVFQNVFQ